jgi:hypothetical protein
MGKKMRLSLSDTSATVNYREPAREEFLFWRHNIKHKAKWKMTFGRAGSALTIYTD